MSASPPHADGGSQEPPTLSYRVYALNEHNHILRPPQTFEATSDEKAIEKAIQLLDGHVLEVWQEARRVVRLLPRKG